MEFIFFLLVGWSSFAKSLFLGILWVCFGCDVNVHILLLEQVVSGIAMPSGSDKLYTGSKDKTVRVWDCQSGQVRLNTFGCLVNRNSGWGTPLHIQHIWRSEQPVFALLQSCLDVTL